MTLNQTPAIDRTFTFGNEVLRAVAHTYQNNGALAVRIIDAHGAPYAMLSTNLDRIAPDGAFWLKDWSENEALARFLIAAGQIEPHYPVQTAIAGFEMVLAYRFREPDATTHVVLCDNCEMPVRVAANSYTKTNYCPACTMQPDEEEFERSRP